MVYRAERCALRRPNLNRLIQNLTYRVRFWVADWHHASGFERLGNCLTVLNLEGKHMDFFSFMEKIWVVGAVF